MVVKCLFSWCILALDTGINTVLFNISKTTLISSCLILSCWLIWFNFWHVLEKFALFIALEMRQVSKQLLLRTAMWLKLLVSGSVSIKTPDCSLYWLTIQKGAVTACTGGKERKKKSPKSGAACIITRSIICFFSSLRSRMVEQEELAAISYLVAMNAVNYKFLSPRI